MSVHIEKYAAAPEPRPLAATPEHRLMLAILDEALFTFQTGLRSRNPLRRREFCEVEAWIASTDCDALFSFENVCEALEIDPECLRAGLKEIKRRVLLEGAKMPRLRVRRRNSPTQQWRGRIGSHGVADGVILPVRAS